MPINGDGNLEVGASTIIARLSTGDLKDASISEVLTLLNVEPGADVTNTASVTSAGALMDSEVDADIKTLVLPASTTISAFGASLIDDAASINGRATLGLVIGTDVQAHDAVLDATTASFLTADETKLDGIEALADVTDYTNVNAALAAPDANLVFNESAGDFDARFEGTTATHLLFLDAGNDRIGINQPTPLSLLDIISPPTGTGVTAGVKITADATGGDGSTVHNGLQVVGDVASGSFDHMNVILGVSQDQTTTGTYNIIEGRGDMSITGSTGVGVLGRASGDNATSNTGTICIGVDGQAIKGDSGHSGSGTYTGGRFFATDGGVGRGIQAYATGNTTSNINAEFGLGTTSGDNGLVLFNGYITDGAGVGSVNMHVNDTLDIFIIDLRDTKVDGLGYWMRDGAGASSVDVYNVSAAKAVSLLSDGGAVFNEQGTATGDLRAESDTQDNKLLLDAGSNLLQTRPGTATSGFGQIQSALHISPTSAATTAVTTEEDLLSYTLPGNSLQNVGDAVRVKWWGTTAANGDNKTLKFYWDGAQIYSSGAVGANNSHWTYEVLIVRTGAATQDVMQSLGWYNAGAIGPAFSSSFTATLSGAVIIKCTGQNGVATAGDIVNEGMSVELLPST